MRKTLPTSSIQFSYALTISRGVSQGAARKLIRTAASSPSQDARDFLAANSYENVDLSDAVIDRVEKDLEEHAANGVAIIPVGSTEYPASLQGIADAPPILFAKGNLALLAKSKNLAIVGTRDASNAGIEIAKRIAAYFSGLGWCTVSGLALGIDAAVHEATLKAFGSTIAVLAHGLHRATPKANEKLAKQILEKGGLWVSEHPYGRPPKPEYFLQRNRIQTGLSVGSIIVEGREKSGSMAQARFCLDQGRKLFAVVPELPENPLKLVSDGTINLVRSNSAIPIRNRNDYPNVESRLEKALKHIPASQP